ncbi:MAG: thiamine pyrophosphate-dependent dehydrogenase E1 component subunit alpha, partial [Myxococcales bacterium]|nr:thiamine pyrophosphate-dependent dehydrogenase E1 component subunit alpha [Myxococcales bacterium]
MQSSPQQVVPIRTPESSFDDDVLTVLQPDGKLNPQNDPKLPVETVVDLYKAMVRTRIVDEQLV